MQPKVQQKYDHDTLKTRGEGRAKWFAGRLELSDETLRGARILEIGCGYGEFCAALEDVYHAEAVGVDPWPRINQGPYAGRSFHKQIDITAEAALGLGLFDYAASFDVLEHVEDPKLALQNLFLLLKPGGRAFLKYNLHRGASAAHLVHLTNVPWCHLVMSDSAIEDLIEAKTGERRRPAWVNKATYAHYILWLNEIGFQTTKHWYVRQKMDREFFEKHRDILIRYPKDDLEKNFMCVILDKPMTEASPRD